MSEKSDNSNNKEKSSKSDVTGSSQIQKNNDTEPNKELEKQKSSNSSQVHCKSKECKCASESCCEDHCSYLKDKNNKSDSSMSTLFFDGMVTNEKEYLQTILYPKILNQEHILKNSKTSFFGWLSNEFKTNKIFRPPTILINSLDYLIKNPVEDFSELNSNEQIKSEEYLQKIYDEDVSLDFENMEISSRALMVAVQKYIKEKIVFFDDNILAKFKEIYNSELSNSEKQSVLNKIPFIMLNRDLFKLIKELIKVLSKQSNLGNSKTQEKIWGDLILSKTELQNKNELIMKDLIK